MIKITKKPVRVEAEAATATNPNAVATPEIVAKPETTPEPELSGPLPEHFLSVMQAAAYVGVSAVTIRRWIKAQVFPCHRAGKQWKIEPKELVSCMRRSAHC